MKEEGRQIEYKERLSDYRNIARTAVAFSNDIGGKIIVGIQDKTLKVTGLDENQIERYLEEIPKALYDAISPSCLPHLNTLLIDDGVVLEIHISAGGKKPYFIKSEGIPRGVYIRVGPHTKRVKEDLLEELFRQGRNQSWDAELLQGIKPEQLDQEALRSFYGNTSWSEDLLLSDKVIQVSPQGEKCVTRSGLLFFHGSPSRILPQQEILLTHFEGKTLDNIITTHDLSAPLPILAEQTLQYIKPHLALSSSHKELKLEATSWQIPLVALREALMNALLHRQYSIPDAIKVALFSDRIEIFSPGNFPGPIDLSQLGNGISYSRNPHLRHLARKAMLVEKRGFGFRLMLSECHKNGNPPPLIIEGPSFVKVTFFRDQREFEIDLDLPDPFEKLSDLRKCGTSFQVREAAMALEVSHSTARTRLKELITLGWLNQKGSGRGSRYIWCR